MAINYQDPDRYKIYEHRAIEPQYKRLVHTVNLRMDKLRKLSEQEGFKGVTKWSMASMLYEARLRGYMTDAGRISSRVPKSDREIMARIKEMQKFLTAPTSTKSGITSIYEKRAKTINDRYGTDFNWQDLAKYFESGAAEKFDSKYGSKTALKSLGQIQKNAEKIKEQVKAHAKKTIIAEDSELQNVVDTMLTDKGLTRLGLY